MNESRTRNSALRKAIVDARLSAGDVAERLGVDPKTVQRWLSGRVPQSAHRRDLARLVRRHEYDLWPAEAGGCPMSPELRCTYPNRGAVPRAVWVELFGSAAREIDVLAYSALFLFDDRELLRLIRERAESGVRVRLALGDPAAPAVAQRGIDERIGSAMPAKVRNALVLSEGLRGASNVEVRARARARAAAGPGRSTARASGRRRSGCGSRRAAARRCAPAACAACRASRRSARRRSPRRSTDSCGP